MEMEHHRVAFTRCLNGLNGRLGEQWLVVVVVYGRWNTYVSDDDDLEL